MTDRKYNLNLILVKNSICSIKLSNGLSFGMDNNADAFETIFGFLKQFLKDGYNLNLNKLYESKFDKKIEI